MALQSRESESALDVRVAARSRSLSNLSVDARQL
jgi:hypothetical protein